MHVGKNVPILTDIKAKSFKSDIIFVITGFELEMIQLRLINTFSIYMYMYICTLYSEFTAVVHFSMKINKSPMYQNRG